MHQNGDWIWCMDDDVYPRADCLEKLLAEDKPDIGILCPKRIQNNDVFINESKKLNLSNPFFKLHRSQLKYEDIISGHPIEIQGMVFEGPLIKRKVVEQIGLPNKDLFIFYDDTDYSYRCFLAGYKVVYIPDAILDKEFFDLSVSKEELLRKIRWRNWYNIRNKAYFCKHYAKNRFFKMFAGVDLLLKMLIVVSVNRLMNRKYERGDLTRVIKMFRDGRMAHLGEI